MNTNRRDFIKITSLASASFIPAARSLAENAGFSENDLSCVLDSVLNSDFHFSIVDKNLLNLHLYFLNVYKKKGYLYPNQKGEAYLIVRIPQQHISEKGFWKSDSLDTPRAYMSGYSYLAFRLWPDWPAAPVKGKIPAKRIIFSIASLLDWNNQKFFQLVTLVEWMKLKDVEKNKLEFVDCAEKDEFLKRKSWSKRDLPEDLPQSNKSEVVPAKQVLAKYKSIIEKLLKDTKPEIVTSRNKSFVPISFFELPNRLFIVPIYRTGKGEKIRTMFWRNQLTADIKEQKTAGNENKFTKKYEVWTNTLQYEKEKDNQFTIETPYFRAIGFYSEKPVPLTCADATVDCAALAKADTDRVKQGAGDGYKNVLPSLLDEEELTFLTQFASNGKEKDFTGPAFDLVEVNGFFFTGLGAITHLKYYNVEERPVGIDLIEYEHVITQGRDVLIKVSRLGYNCKSGQKYKHVIEGRRIVDDNGNSFLELNQYCEHIDPKINYGELPDEQHWVKTYAPIPDTGRVDLTSPVLSNECHFRRNIFTSLELSKEEHIPIDCLQNQVIQRDVDVLQCLRWFWPIRMVKDIAHPPEPKELALTDYLSCDHVGTDWESSPIPGSMPFMFIRASAIEEGIAGDGTIKPGCELEAAYKNYLDNAPEYIQRRKTWYNRKIAFTPAINGSDVQNKTNIIETDFIDVYFNIKNISLCKDPVTHAQLPVQKIKYVVFPQVLRAKLFIDHVRDLTQNKIPSVVEFHDHYIKGAFDKDFTDGLGQHIQNYGKVILKNTDAFMNRVQGGVGLAEEPVNQTYGTITNALAQAKDKLGNIALPDISPDSISLEKFGITLPDNISDTIAKGNATIDNAVKKFKQFNPIELLRGKFSEILGGIDLRAILDQLIPSENSPLFEIQKIADEVNKIQSTISTSAIYAKILDTVGNIEIPDPRDTTKTIRIQALVKELSDSVKDLTGQLVNAERSLKTKLEALSNAIPMADQLNIIVKNLWQQYRTKAFALLLDGLRFNDVKEAILDQDVKMRSFIIDELVFLESQFQTKRDELKTAVSDARNELTGTVVDQLVAYPELRAKIDEGIQLINEVTDEYNNYFPNPADPTRLNNLLTDIFSALLNTTEDNVQLQVQIGGATVAVFFDPATLLFQKDNGGGNFLPYTLLATTDAGYLQLSAKIDDIHLFVTRNLNGTAFQQNAVGALQLKFNQDAYKDKLDQLEIKVNNYCQVQLAVHSKALQKWVNTYTNVLNDAINRGAPAVVSTASSQLYNLVLKLSPYIDFLRNLDPFYYYNEYKRLQKDIDDIKKRFPESIAAVFTEVVEDKVRSASQLYHKVVNQFFLDRQLDKLADAETKVSAKLTDIVKTAILHFAAVFPLAAGLYDDILKAESKFKEVRDDLAKTRDYYENLVKSKAASLARSFEDKVKDFIDEEQKKMLGEVNPATVQEILDNIEEARNIYQLLTSIKQQDLTYTWSTNNFRDVNLGIVAFKKFSNPDTELDVNVRMTTYFVPGKFPPAVDRIETYAENRFKNFGISLFSILTVNFSEITFIAGSDHGTHFDVKIKSVQFDGALSFVQAFENYLKTLGGGLILDIEPDHVALGYSLPIPSIQTPGFSFFNLTLNFDFRLHFDKRPMRFGFSLATAENKFGIAVYIFAGFGFFSIVAEPKRGIVEIDAALEAGAWAGFSLGPIHGEVKLAFGFRYTKGDFGTRLEGYIVAEGRLAVWIIEVAARIYLGIISENSSVEGSCTVSYSIKLGFFKKSFSGTFHKQISGAKSQSRDQPAERHMVLARQLFDRVSPTLLPTLKANTIHSPALLLTMERSTHSGTAESKRLMKHVSDNFTDETVTETYCVTESDWNDYFDRF